MSDYEIGYAKPPVRTQFQKGDAGNRKGRKKGSMNTLSILGKLLDSKIFITQDDKQHKVSKRQALLLRTVNDALKGCPKATQIILPHVFAVDAKREENEKIKAQTLGKSDREILEAALGLSVVRPLEEVRGTNMSDEGETNKEEKDE